MCCATARASFKPAAGDGCRDLGNQPGIAHGGCWAHARRKSLEAREASKTKGSADVGMAGIDALFRIGRTLREQDLIACQFMQRRREQAQAVLEKLLLWLQEREGKVPPSPALGKGIGCTLGQWPKLIRYLGSLLPGPDNYACERAIRPFGAGHRNWMLSGSPAGAEASAAWYGLVETAKLNSIEPYLCLCDILARLPDTENTEDYRFLLPWRNPKESLLDFEPGRLARTRSQEPPHEHLRRGAVCFTVTLEVRRAARLMALTTALIPVDLRRRP